MLRGGPRGSRLESVRIEGQGNVDGKMAISDSPVPQETMATSHRSGVLFFRSDTSTDVPHANGTRFCSARWVILESGDVIGVPSEIARREFTFSWG